MPMPTPTTEESHEADLEGPPGGPRGGQRFPPVHALVRGRDLFQVEGAREQAVHGEDGLVRHVRVGLLADLPSPRSNGVQRWFRKRHRRVQTKAHVENTHKTLPPVPQ